MKNKKDSFKNLQDKWYTKLEESGFKDIEKNDHLKWTSNSRAIQSRLNNQIEGQEAIRDYYRLAGFFLHDYAFKSNKDKVIWQLHAEGVSHRNICNALAKLGIRMVRSQVWDILDKLRLEMYSTYKNKRYESE